MTSWASVIGQTLHSKGDAIGVAKGKSKFLNAYL
jgi:hypothetical protein